MNDQEFRDILDWFGLCWDGYRKVRKGVKKRLARHMQQVGCRSIGQYLVMLEKNPELKQECMRLLTVSISRFFRDRILWQMLEQYLIGVVGAAMAGTLKVWSAGCACGEEAYSFKILWDLLKDRCERLPKLELWGTDINPEVLERARAGVYSWSSLKNVPQAWLNKYFISQERERKFVIVDFLKENIVWKIHDLLSDEPPQKDFRIIFLRNNLLTYYEEPLQLPAFDRVIGSLLPGGWLLIGEHERLRCLHSGLSVYRYHPRIFEKLSTQTDPAVCLSPAPLHENNDG